MVSGANPWAVEKVMLSSAESSAPLKAIICIKHFFLLLSRSLLLMKPYLGHEIAADTECHYPEEQPQHRHLTAQIEHSLLLGEMKVFPSISL